MSIQFGLNGLSFSIVNTYSQQVEKANSYSFQHPISLSELATEVEKLISENNLRDYVYEEVIAIHNNALFNVVPSALFNKENLADYLKFNTALLPNDIAACDNIPEWELQSVYIPYTNVNNVLIDNFGAFEYVHISTVILKALMLEPGKKETSAYLYVNNSSALLVLFKNNRLELINHYEISNEDDLTYYVLFALEQSQIDPSEVSLKVLGGIENGDSYYRRLYTFIKEVNFETNPIKWDTNKVLDHNLLTTLAIA